MRPFYSVNFNARVCNMQISVNGVPLIRMEVTGQCSTTYPFNNLLLESGYATIRYEARPLKGELQLRKEAHLRGEVELYDLDSGYEPISRMALFETPEQNDTPKPFIIHENVFQVSVPYSVVGWQKSISLDRYENYIKDMVFNKYNSLITMLKNHSISQYADAFKEREDIMATCFYMSEEDRRERIDEIERLVNGCTRISPLTDLDIIEYAADKRLVRLIKVDGESSLRLINEENYEETMMELWLHLKPGSNVLTVI